MADLDTNATAVRRRAYVLLMPAAVFLALSGCSPVSPGPALPSETRSSVAILAINSAPVSVADGAAADVSIRDERVMVAVVGIRGADASGVPGPAGPGSQIVLDIREGSGPTASATLTSGDTVAVAGAAVRATAQPKATAYDPATVRFEVVSGAAEVTPQVPVAARTPGATLTLGPTMQGPLDLGGSTPAVVSIVNAGRQALVVGFSIGTGPAAEQGVHHLVSGDVTTIGGHPVRVESDGAKVTLTAYA